MLGGCASQQLNKDELFEPATPFSKTVPLSGDTVCWSVKRAFLSQGYLLDRSSDSVIMTGTKDTQLDDKTSISLRLQTTCVDNRDGSSTIFATANRETAKLQSVITSFSAGVSFATVTVPSGMEKVLRVVSRETIKDPQFYERFYLLVESYAQEEWRQSRARARQQKKDVEDRVRN
jgi:hypothetical protein